MFNTDLADDGFSYGLGIIGVPLLPGWIGHGGGLPGWSAVGLYNADTGAVFVAMSNGISGTGPALEAWVDEQFS